MELVKLPPLKPAPICQQTRLVQICLDQATKPGALQFSQSFGFEVARVLVGAASALIPTDRPAGLSYTNTVNVASERSTGRYSVSRSTGLRPALRIRCNNSARRSPCWVVAPASW